MPFYTFNQNNSGGYFKGPASTVIIEANDADDANHFARKQGLYFDGVGDCSCCGNRWQLAWECEATDTPLIYGQSPQEYQLEYKGTKRGEKGVLVVYLDGTVRKY